MSRLSLRASSGVAICVLSLSAGCGILLGFEDHEPFPETRPGGGGQGPGGAGGEAGLGGTAGMGGEGGVGGGLGTDVLLIPDRGEDAVGMYSVVDGTYLGDFIPPITGNEPYTFSSPNIAAQGPDGMIYVADQIADLVVRFAPDGTFDTIFADQSDGLDNVRGIDFRDGELFASNSPSGGGDAVLRFSLDGTRLADFVADDSAPFDILFLPSGTMMMADIGATDGMRLYDVDASSFSLLHEVFFPQQVQPLDNGNFVVAAWDEAIEMEPDGDVVRSLVVDMGRGIHPLEDGNWLICSDAGVLAINPFSMEVIQSARVGTGFTKIERVTLSVTID